MFGVNVRVATWSDVLRAERVVPTTARDGVSVVRSTVSKLPFGLFRVIVGALLEPAPSAVTFAVLAIENELVELSVAAPAVKVGRSPRRVTATELFCGTMTGVAKLNW